MKIFSSMNKLEIVKLSLLAIITLCLVIIVIQGFGGGTQDVYVRGGDVDVSGGVSVHGSVSVDNIVDVNVEGVQGRRIGSHRSYTIDGKEYNAIDVYKSNW